MPDNLISAIAEAQTVILKGNGISREVIKRIAAGRLRFMELPPWTLNALKRELKDWDISKEKWKGYGTTGNW